MYRAELIEGPEAVRRQFWARPKYIFPAIIIFGLFPTFCPAQARGPITLGPSAKQYFDSIVQDSRASDVEVGACVNKYRYGANGDTIFLKGVIAARYEWSNSIGISKGPWPGGHICPGTMPGVHTHLLSHVKPNYPSCTDSLTARTRQTAWDLVLDVSEEDYTLVLQYLPDSVRIRTLCKDSL